MTGSLSVAYKFGIHIIFKLEFKFEEKNRKEEAYLDLGWFSDSRPTCFLSHLGPAPIPRACSKPASWGSMVRIVPLSRIRMTRSTVISAWWSQGRCNHRPGFPRVSG